VWRRELWELELSCEKKRGGRNGTFACGCSRRKDLQAT
jgi:hypothetical protein